MIIQTPRLTLRDFEPRDRDSFVTYQMDPRYRRLYDLNDDPARPNELFDLFLSWQLQKPRQNFQLGLFDSAAQGLLGCVGLRLRPENCEAAVFGIELAPSHWGRFRVAIVAADSMIRYGFETLHLRRIVGDTASGNKRVEKLARWFGATIIGQRDGPEWMGMRGWQEVSWALTRFSWLQSNRARQMPDQVSARNY